jgi:hypothetical protein
MNAVLLAKVACSYSWLGVLLYEHLPLLFGSSGHVGFPMLKTSLFINTKYYAMCGSNDGHRYSI